MSDDADRSCLVLPTEDIADHTELVVGRSDNDSPKCETIWTFGRNLSGVEPSGGW